MYTFCLKFTVDCLHKSNCNDFILIWKNLKFMDLVCCFSHKLFGILIPYCGDRDDPSDGFRLRLVPHGSRQVAQQVPLHKVK